MRRYALAALLLFSVSSLVAQTAPTSILKWRNIGPHRGGRIRAMAGVPQLPYTFYFAQVNGGVFKTDDAGRTWTPIFDSQPTASVGAIAVAPSDPNTLYVGSGEGLARPDLSVGDGVYRSTDAGHTWQRLGLNDAQQIPAIAVDPTNPFRLFVAALGHPYGPSKQRGIFRSLDGGETYQPVLVRDENVGGNDVDIDPTNPFVIYANLWEQRQGPWENAAWTGNGGGLYKSTDGGDTWKQLTNGLPANTNQVNLAIAPSNSKILYAAVASNGPPATVGVFKSIDSGESWEKITSDPRPASRIGGGDLPMPIVNPKNPDVVIMASTVAMKTVDGGKTWAPYKGAPGGDDYQNGFINPTDTSIVYLVADQGAVVSLNAGKTWSTWYNQSTGQMYHVMADNAFPYRLCSGQQESGSACVSSRGDWGAITVREWGTVGVDEYGYVAPDPLDPNIVFGGRSVSRYDRRTGQQSTVGPLTGRTFPPGQNPYRQVRTMPVVFSQANPKQLFFANNFLFTTVDAGVTWKQISPDLTRKTWTIPASVGKYTDTSQVAQRGVIYTVGPSPMSANVIWVGTDDGLIHKTVNAGVTWSDVTPPDLGAWWKVFMIDAGHFDQATAYAAVNTLRLDDMRPHLYKTHDGGKTWTDISALPDAAGPANALREDPKKKGLLYAATERGVYVSFDDGASWQSLRLNLPASSVRDLIVKDDDIAIATHGRGFWILDDITTLRQWDASIPSHAAHLFAPPAALRVRYNTNDDTPLPPDEPMGENPPDGAGITYSIKDSSEVKLEILDARKRVVREYSSADSLPWQMPTNANAAVPLYWYRNPVKLSGGAGIHRFYWDVHYQNLPIPRGGFGGGFGLPISATPYNTAPAATTPWVAPGNYTVRLTVNGQSQTEPIVVKQDPRARENPLALKEIYQLTDSMYFTIKTLVNAMDDLRANRTRIAGVIPTASKEWADSLTKFSDRMGQILEAQMPADTSRRGGPPAGGGGGGGGFGGNQGPPLSPTSLRGALTGLAGQLNSFQAADVGATATQRAAIGAALKNANAAVAQWTALRAVLPK